MTAPNALPEPTREYRVIPPTKSGLPPFPGPHKLTLPYSDHQPLPTGPRHAQKVKVTITDNQYLRLTPGQRLIVSATLFFALIAIFSVLHDLGKI